MIFSEPFTTNAIEMICMKKLKLNIILIKFMYPWHAVKRIQRQYLHRKCVFTVFCQKHFGKFYGENNSWMKKMTLLNLTLHYNNLPFWHYARLLKLYSKNLSFEESIVTSLNWIHPIFGRCLFGSFDENDGNILE